MIGQMASSVIDRAPDPDETSGVVTTDVVKNLDSS